MPQPTRASQDGSAEPLIGAEITFLEPLALLVRWAWGLAHGASVVSSARRYPGDDRLTPCGVCQLGIERHVPARWIDPNQRRAVHVDNRGMTRLQGLDQADSHHALVAVVFAGAAA